jgi:hypothetical protein
MKRYEAFLALKGFANAVDSLLEGKHVSDIKKMAKKFLGLMEGGYAGKAGTKPEDVDPEQLAMGEKVELEHTDNKKIARKIALDHLTEFPNYYTGLKEMEEKLKAGKMSKAIAASPSVQCPKCGGKNAYHKEQGEDCDGGQDEMVVYCPDCHRTTEQ